MRDLQRTTCLLLAGFLLLVTPRPVFPQEGELERATLHVGFGPTSFLSVNLTDAKAAFKVFTESVGREKGYDLEVEVHTYDSNEAFKTAAADQNLHLVIMLAWDYFSTNLHEFLEPRFLALESGYGLREYLLLVAADAPYREVADLRGRHVALLENTNCEMSRQWIQTLLMEQGLGDEREFFDRVEIDAKPTKVLLPVFFGKADACVVTRPIFDTMCELNPQLGRRLRSIAVSEPLVDAMICLAREGWESPRQRPDMIDSLAKLHENPHGKQILTLFKVDSLVPFEESLMVGTRELKAKHDRLLSEMEEGQRGAKIAGFSGTEPPQPGR